MTIINTTDPVVSIGIDAAVVADHQVAIRGPGVRDDFRVPPTLAGMSKLTERLRPHADALVVVEPTAGTWLPLTMAVTAAGCRIGFVQNRDSARLRSAISGRNKTDAIDADMLARCEHVLGVDEAPVPLVGQVGLRRALTRRHHMVVDAHRSECRLWSLLIWVMPDVWRAAGGHTIIQPLLSRWPDMGALGRARVDSITQIVAAHSRDSDPSKRGERIRDAARGWSDFWDGRLDLDDIAWRSPNCWTTSPSLTGAPRQQPIMRWGAGNNAGPMTCCCRYSASDRSAPPRREHGGARAHTCAPPKPPEHSSG